MTDRKRFSFLFLNLTMFSLLIYLFSTLVGIIVIDQMGLELDNNISSLLSVGIMYGIAFPIFYFLVKRLPKSTSKGREIPTAKNWIIWIVMSFGMGYIGNMIGQILMLLLQVVSGIQVLNPVEEMIDSLNLGVLFFTTVIVAPIMEEWIFRKIIIDRLRPYGEVVCVVLSGISFGLFHGNFFQFFYAAGIGMIFASIYYSTGKLQYSILLHALINLFGGVIPVILIGEINEDNLVAWIVMGLIGLMVITMIIATIVLLIVTILKKKPHPPMVDKSVSQIFKSAIFNFGSCAFVIFSILVFATNILSSVLG